jgi:hypothetical protein
MGSSMQSCMRGGHDEGRLCGSLLHALPLTGRLVSDQRSGLRMCGSRQGVAMPITTITSAGHAFGHPSRLLRFMNNRGIASRHAMSRGLTTGVSLVALAIAATAIVAPQAWAASGGGAFSPGSGQAVPGGAGGTDGTAVEARGKNGPAAGNTNSAGGGGATDLTTGLGATGGGSSANVGALPGASKGAKVNDNRPLIDGVVAAERGALARSTAAVAVAALAFPRRSM